MTKLKSWRLWTSLSALHQRCGDQILHFEKLHLAAPKVVTKAHQPAAGLVEVAPGLPAKAAAILNFFGRPLTN
jgi:hypothetical protein